MVRIFYLITRELWIFNFSILRKLRNEIYRKKFKAGDNLRVGRNVSFKLSHPSNNTMVLIGDNVTIDNDVMIDYTGGIRIESGVTISEGVKIFTHDHSLSALNIQHGEIIKSPLHIEGDVWIGANAIILQKVRSIEEGAIIAAGSVVTKNVGAFEVVGGNPSQVLKKRVFS